jgi:membrane-associated HD superfamily phosphohydrolase
MFLKKIKIPRVRITSIMKKPAIILILFVAYSIFLSWIFTKTSFDGFIFFVLLFYIPIFYILGMKPKISIVIALILLIVCAITLTQGYEDYANRIAIYAYYFLVIGFVLIFIDYLIGFGQLKE